MYKQFQDLKFKEHPYSSGIMAREIFDNGYGVSVVRTENSYGGSEGLFEVAVVNASGGLNYNTPITDDVIGELTEEEVSDVMRRVQELPGKPEEDGN